MREGGNGAGNRALRERARENSSSLFMSFLFDLLSSRSRFLFRPLDQREYKSREREGDGENGKKGGKYAWRHSSAREGAGNLSFARGGKNATFFRVAGRVAPADFSHKETE